MAFMFPAPLLLFWFSREQGVYLRVAIQHHKMAAKTSQRAMLTGKNWVFKHGEYKTDVNCFQCGMVLGSWHETLEDKRKKHVYNLVLRCINGKFSQVFESYFFSTD